MERNGFTTPGFESNKSSSEDVSEKPKTKKKKSVESAPVAVESKKKEEVADKGKTLWEKLVGDDKEKPAEKPDKKAEKETESTKEAVAENDPALEQLTPEEEVEITRRLMTDQLDELESGRTAEESPADAEAREAAIVMLLESLAEMPEATVEDESDELEIEQPEQEDNEPEASEQEIDEPIELDDTEPISLKGGSGGRGTPPPPVPGSPQPSSTPPPSPAGRSSARVPHGATTPANTFNTAPAAVSGEYVPDYQNNPNATYFLVGGVVGYLMGRRRGRIKTEKRMKVVQEKLEKQVEEKQKEIIAKTEAVKILTREKYEQQYNKSAKTQTALVSQTERHPAQPRDEISAELPDKTAPEQISQTPLAVVAAERTSIANNETKLEKDEKPKSVESSPVPQKSVELEDKDILKMSEEINVGATSLRKVYEAKLISRAGLKRLVGEHLQGKDIRRGLAREFLAKELSYERDPKLRDMLPGEESKTAKAASQPNEQAGPVDLLSGNAPANSNQSSKSNAPSGKANSSTSSKKTVSTGVLTVLSLLALGLAAYAVVLTLTH